MSLWGNVVIVILLKDIQNKECGLSYGPINFSLKKSAKCFQPEVLLSLGGAPIYVTRSLFGDSSIVEHVLCVQNLIVT